MATHLRTRHSFTTATHLRTRHSHWAALCLFVSLNTLLVAPRSIVAQDDEAGFIPLFDGSTLSGWVIAGGDAESFTAAGGALQVRGPRGWLRSAAPFSDFTLRLDFRFLAEGADSGIFFRASSIGEFGRGWPNGSYQIQLRDMRAPSNFLPLGHLYRHGMPQGETNHQGAVAVEAFRGVGEWHRIEVAVDGESVVVLLEGREILRGGSIGNASGYIGFQGEAGEVEYRSIRIRTR
jgi:hypothetical protein